jgi:hypothetical protein
LIQKGIEEGNLEIIALVGLRASCLPHILQAYIDKTGDIQSAAYIAAYSITARKSEEQSE